MKRIAPIALMAAAAVISSCSDRNGWTVEGHIADHPDSVKVALEAFSGGRWMTVDSIEVSNGDFKYRASAPAAYPDVMRLSVNGRTIYFPVDSIDCITVNVTKDAATISGTPQARTINSIDSLISAASASRAAADVVADSTLKSQAFAKAFNDPSILPLYYLINKSVGTLPLYNVDRSSDLRLYRAVAQRFATERPDDPRTAWLVNTVTTAANRGKTATIEVPTTGLFDIVRHDAKGKRHSLAEMAAKGNVVLLSFTAYGSEASAPYNAILGQLWDKYHASGLDIYQIAFDPDEAMWRMSAVNIPWTAVWNSTTDGNKPLMQYNVGSLPATFIIDRQGQIAARVSNPAELPSAVAKYI